MIWRSEAHAAWHLKAALFTFAAIVITDAHAVKLYKWVDENGSTHYHQTPPPVGTPFVEEKEFDGQLNVVPSAASEADSGETSPGTRQSDTADTPTAGDKENNSDTAETKSPTPEEKTAVAEEGGTEPTTESPSVGAEPSGGSETATGSSGASGGASSAGAGTASGATVAPAPIPSPPVAVPFGGP